MNQPRQRHGAVSDIDADPPGLAFGTPIQGLLDRLADVFGHRLRRRHGDLVHYDLYTR